MIETLNSVYPGWGKLRLAIYTLLAVMAILVTISEWGNPLSAPFLIAELVALMMFVIADFSMYNHGKLLDYCIELEDLCSRGDRR